MEEKGASAAASERPQLLDSVRDAIRRRHYSPRTEESYVHGMRRFIYFSRRRHPRQLGAPKVTAFLNHLLRERSVVASTQNQVLSTLLLTATLTSPIQLFSHLQKRIRKFSRLVFRKFDRIASPSHRLDVDARLLLNPDANFTVIQFKTFNAFHRLKFLDLTCSPEIVRT